MNHHISSIIVILVGLFLIIFRKKFARYQVAFQNKYFGQHFGTKEIRVNEWLLPLIGIIAIGIALLDFIGKFQST